MMSAGAAPSIVRFRIPCHDLAEYQARLASEYELNGVFIPQERIRPRPVGSRVLLKIELSDRSLAYSGDAVVAAHVFEPGRAGFVLNLETPGAGDEGPATPDGVTVDIEIPPAVHSAAPAPQPVAAATPVPPRSPAPVLPRAATPVPRRTVLTEAIFDDEPAPPPSPAPAPSAFVGLDDVTVEVPSRPVALEAASSVPSVPSIPAGLGPAEAELLGLTPTPLVVRSEVSLRLRPTPRPEPAEAPLQEEPEPAAEVTSTPGQFPLPPSRRWRRMAVAAVAAGAVLAAGGLVLRARRNAVVVELAAADAIRVADERLQAGRLAVPPGDSALDHLLTARRLRPGDGRVTARLELLAETLDGLGRRAAARDDLEEAAAHLSAALRADPRRERTRAALEGIEARQRDPERQGGQESRRPEQDGKRRRVRAARSGAAG
jgi:hypothetical protein